MNAPIDQDSFIKDRLIVVLSALGELGDVFTRRAGIDQAGRYLLRMVLGTAGISWGAFYAYHSSDSSLVLDASTRPELETIPSIPLPERDVRTITEIREPVLMDSLPEDFLKIIHPVRDLWIRSGVRAATVLHVNYELIGVLCFGKRFMSDGFDAIDLEIMALLSRHVGLLLQNQKLLKSAHEVNLRLNRKILELEHISGIGLAVTHLGSVEEISQEILNRAVAITDARYGALYVQSETGSQLVHWIGFEPGKLPPVLQGVPYMDAFPNPATAGNDRSLVVPMEVRGRVAGHLVLAGKESRSDDFIAFTSEDRYVLSAFANQAAVALDNARLYQTAIEKERMEREIAVAAEIQRSILPRKSPESPGIELAGYTIPCRTIGGDYFDFIPLPGNRMLIAIADVSGKGVPASLLVSTVHAVLHTFRHQDQTLSRMISTLNELIISASPDNKFVTACIGIWNPESLEFEYVIAGHEPPLVIEPDGSCKHLEGSGLILGMFEGIQFESCSIRISDGRCLCLYTDGVTDVKNECDERFGIERLKDLCARIGRFPAQSFLDDVVRTVNDFRGNAAAPDDQTVVILKSR